MKQPRQIINYIRILAILLVLIPIVHVLADYLGPDRTVTTWTWERLHCEYFAMYDPPGPGYYGCYLHLYDTPSGSCPPESSTQPYFNPIACVSWTGTCGVDFSCDISLSSSIDNCMEGQPGCTSTSHTVTYPEATISGVVNCAQYGLGGWCVSGGNLSLAASEPVSGYFITYIEGTHNGSGFSCLGDFCLRTLVEGSNNFTYWAHSSWNDTSLMGTASIQVDSRPPVISGSLSGTGGSGDWFTSAVTLEASASDPVPGSGLSALEYSLDGGGWTVYLSPLTFTEGNHTINLRAADLAGNTAAYSTIIHIDTQPPFSVFTTPLPFSGWVRGELKPGRHLRRRGERRRLGGTLAGRRGRLAVADWYNDLVV